MSSGPASEHRCLISSFDMLRIFSALVGTLIFVSLPCKSQETWNGLRFGMSVSEVKAKMPLTKDQKERGTYRGTTVNIVSLSFSSQLRFAPPLTKLCSLMTFQRQLMNHMERGGSSAMNLPENTLLRQRRRESAWIIPTPKIRCLIASRSGQIAGSQSR